MSSSAFDSIRARSAPLRTASPASPETSSMEPPSSARTVATRSGRSSPEITGPTTMWSRLTTTTFSDPTCTVRDSAGGWPFSVSAPQPAIMNAAASISLAAAAAPDVNNHRRRFIAETLLQRRQPEAAVVRWTRFGADFLPEAWLGLVWELRAAVVEREHARHRYPD